MIAFGPMSLTLLIGAIQGLVIAAMLLGTSRNRQANRFLALLIVAVVSMMTPYIIGYAGFYDAYPWLSFAPFGTSLAFGPLLLFYARRLTGHPLPALWTLHFAPYLVQFLANALVFPFPLETKNWWDGAVHAGYIAPALTYASLLSLTIYAFLTLRRYRAYCSYLAQNRTDGAEFDPSWIRNAALALGATALVWAGFALADLVDPSRNYFDQFWMYVGLGLLTIYLGVEGWRNAGLAFPAMGAPPPPDTGAAAPERDWSVQAAAWAAEADRKRLWRDPEVTLAAMARALGTNTAYLSRALNEGLGMTFSTFINTRRVEEMKRLLSDASEQRDLTQLAFEAGFNSKASFNRAFADLTGMTPSAFRKSARLKS